MVRVANEPRLLATDLLQPVRLLFIDSETGGLDPTHSSLLTLSCVVTEADGLEIACLDLNLKPDDGEAIVATEKALQINGIDIERHAYNALTYTQGRSELCRFLDRHRPHDGIANFIPVGFHVQFDLGFIWHHLLPRSTWETYVSYAAEDLKGTARFIHRAQGIQVGHSLDAVAAHYGMARTPGPHTSHGDVRLLRDVFFRLADAVR